MISLRRPQAPDPYELLPHVPSFTLRSDDFEHGDRLPDEHTNTDKGANVSPHLAWSGFPAETQSFLVSCFDPDAPGPSGWWHWTLLDLPADLTELARGTAAPTGTFALRGDDGRAEYVGAAPPPRDAEHRYYFAVHALDVASMGLSKDAMPGAANTAAVFHTIARAVLIGTYQQTGA